MNAARVIGQKIRGGELSQEHYPAAPEKQTLMLSFIEEHAKLSE